MLIVAVGLMEGLPAVEAELLGEFTDPAGVRITPGRRRFEVETTLTPADPPSSAFALDDVTIGIGFHWERKERQVFRGALRILRRPSGLTVVNDVPLEEYVASVISSEMSATCPLELLKAHAVISRSWLKGPAAAGIAPCGPDEPGEIRRWYGREAHPDFEVCADDHCQRYQGITKAVSPAVADAVGATAGEMLVCGGAVCDARFSKCCGGLTERYDTAWDDQEIPYLVSLPDGLEGPVPADLEEFIRANPAAFCNTARRGAPRPHPSRFRPGNARLLPLDRLVHGRRAGRARRRAPRRRSRPDHRPSSRSRAAPRGGSSASGLRESAARSSSARSSRSGVRSRPRTSTARRSSWIGTRPAASSSPAPAGGTASASARSGRPSWRREASRTGRSSRTTTRGRRSGVSAEPGESPARGGAACRGPTGARAFRELRSPCLGPTSAWEDGDEKQAFGPRPGRRRGGHRRGPVGGRLPGALTESRRGGDPEADRVPRRRPGPVRRSGRCGREARLADGDVPVREDGHWQPGREVRVGVGIPGGRGHRLAGAAGGVESRFGRERDARARGGSDPEGAKGRRRRPDDRGRGRGVRRRPRRLSSFRRGPLETPRPDLSPPLPDEGPVGKSLPLRNGIRAEPLRRQHGGRGRLLESPRVVLPASRRDRPRGARPGQTSRPLRDRLLRRCLPRFADPGRAERRRPRFLPNASPCAPPLAAASAEPAD